MNANERQRGAESRISLPAEPGSVTDQLWTLPNVICVGRFLGSLLLPLVAYSGSETAFVVMVALLFASDWIDGKLAIWLNQRSVLGARIDSVADATFYGMSGLCVVWLKWSEMGGLALWIAAAIGAYVITCAAAYRKYGRLPSYHTYGAKICNWLMLGGLVYWFVWDQIWPLRIALALVSLANLETLMMTLILPKWKADVPTFWHAQSLLTTKSPRHEEFDQPLMDANSRE